MTSLEQFDPAVHVLKVVESKNALPQVIPEPRGFLNSKPIRWLMKLFGYKAYDIQKIADTIVALNTPDKTRNTLYVKLLQGVVRKEDEEKQQQELATKGETHIDPYKKRYPLMWKIDSLRPRQPLPEITNQPRENAVRISLSETEYNNVLILAHHSPQMMAGAAFRYFGRGPHPDIAPVFNEGKGCVTLEEKFLDQPQKPKKIWTIQLYKNSREIDLCIDGKKPDDVEVAKKQLCAYCAYARKISY